MQRLEVSDAVRPLYVSLGVKGLICRIKTVKNKIFSLVRDAVDLFGHKINYISPVFGFWVIRRNQKRMGSSSSHVTPQLEMERNIFTLFVWKWWDLTYLCRGVHTLLENGLTDTVILHFWFSVVKFMSFVEEKRILGVSFMTKILT